MDALSSLSFDSPVGRLRVTATPEHLIEVKLNAPEMPDSAPEGSGHRICEEARRQILGFLEGRRRNFDLPMRIVGSRFQRDVLRSMAKIPFGLTATYGDLARSVGEPGGSRAVGAACGANPLALVIPCHRVVGKGNLGGFGGGVEMKRWLLELEALGRPPKPMGSRQDDKPPSPNGIDGEQQTLF
ncbi:MAG: methylated-DNA--[protein]-cysteine S-methyltransferase [Acidobacteriota bacterium]